MSEWRPIETAPKDGTFIDLWSRRFGSRTCNARWVVESGEGLDYPHLKMHGWKTYKEDEYQCLSERQFTHWMPLPKPPISIDANTSD